MQLCGIGEPRRDLDRRDGDERVVCARERRKVGRQAPAEPVVAVELDPDERTAGRERPQALVGPRQVLLARLTLGEPITGRTVVAMAVALAGLALMLGAPGEGSLAGDGLSFLVTLAFALSIVITRWRRDVSMAPAACLSQVIVLAAFLPFASPGEIGGDDVGWLAALGIGQIALGFVLFAVGARLIPAAQVGLITLLEVVLGPLWVWLALDERPSALTLVGGAIVIAAIVIQTRAAPPPEPADEPAFPAPH